MVSVIDTLLSRDELEFQLFELHQAQKLQTYARYSEHDLSVCESILDIAYQLAEEEFLPHADKLDSNEPHFDGTQVHIIPEVAKALSKYREAGFFGASFDESEGGLQLPWIINQAVVSVFASANIGTLGYAVLTVAAANLLKTFGTESQIDTYLPPMVEGKWFGTMCLSEPHAGSSLSDITTKALPNDDGSYSIKGTKMWISGGEHDLAENIIHMVLARMPDSPPGVAGISLFLVPKRCLNEQGEVGGLNGVHLAGVNHKMGWRGTVNTLLNFGDNNECRGFLIGEVNKGLSYMFHMLNEARIAVGLEATALAAAGYTVSRDYAMERVQGRHPDEKNASAAPVAIIEHADVRRLLLQQRAYIEGSLALLLFCAKLIDLERVEENQADRKNLSLLLDLLTPIAKGWPSEYCPIANKNAIQILGGAGYTRDFPVERLYRDNRLNAIHDGTTAMQAIDLLGRKVRMAGGAAFDLLVLKMSETISDCRDIDSLHEFANALQLASDELVQTTKLMQYRCAGDERLYLANATIYLEAVGFIVIGWMWLQQGLLATQLLLKNGRNKAEFYEGKLATLRYYFRCELPSVAHRLALLKMTDDTCVGTDTSIF